MRNPPIAHCFPTIEDDRPIPLSAPLRGLIAANDSPSLGQRRRRRFGGIPAPNLVGFLII